MSDDHEELADRLEQEANYLEAAGERNDERGEEAREALSQAQRDEYTPAALGDEDPAYRTPSAAEQAEDEEADAAPPEPSSPGDKVEASLRKPVDADGSDGDG